MPAETRFQEIQRYVRLDERDAELLRAFGELARPELVGIATRFYDRIREHEQAHAVLAGEEQIQRLQRTLVGWLQRVLSGRYDEAHHQQTSTIGRVHVRIGLPQRYMLTAMALIRVELLRIADRTLGSEAAATREAIARVLDLELAIMLEAYQDSFVERIEHSAAQERSALGDTLRLTQQRYVHAVELAGVIMVGVDADGMVQLFNREAERVTGYARDEACGRSAGEILGFDPETDARLRGYLESSRDADGAESFESSLRTRAGKLRDVLWSLSSTTIQGDDVMLLVTGRDVTEERASEERARQNERLAAVGALAGSLAHELRNPLNGARLHVSLLRRAIQRDADKQEMLEATDIMGGQVARLSGLVTAFLDFTRPRRPDFGSASLSEALDRACEQAAASAHDAGTSIICDRPGTDVRFDADGGQLTQALVNLLNNAVEAGSRTVRLRGRRGPRQVFIDVEDDGPALPVPDAPVYDAFHSRRDGSTGLGLAIAYRIISDHRGTIDVSSRPGQTTFRIALPLEQDAGATP